MLGECAQGREGSDHHRARLMNHHGESDLVQGIDSFMVRILLETKSSGDHSGGYFSFKENFLGLCCFSALF